MGGDRGGNRWAQAGIALKLLVLPRYVALGDGVVEGWWYRLARVDAARAAHAGHGGSSAVTAIGGGCGLADPTRRCSPCPPASASRCA